jgi:ornithine--oxo-acid transaminase
MMTINPGEHGSTFGGNPLASAILMAAVKVIQDEDLVENSAKMGQRLLKNLSQLKHLPIVKEIRGKGLLNAIEFHPQANRKIGQEFCYDLIGNGILVSKLFYFFYFLGQGDTSDHCQAKSAAHYHC